ncbi:MAG: hypothetical protein U9O87_09985 [Verrucomicrobiota bacterium]|nr:hypothetical protein [Verrucomicrobiota bacterium]
MNIFKPFILITLFLFSFCGCSKKPDENIHIQLLEESVKIHNSYHKNFPQSKLFNNKLYECHSAFYWMGNPLDSNPYFDNVIKIQICGKFSNKEQNKIINQFSEIAKNHNIQSKLYIIFYSKQRNKLKRYDEFVRKERIK